jgi:hypothetical protein
MEGWDREAMKRKPTALSRRRALGAALAATIAAGGLAAAQPLRQAIAGLLDPTPR